MMEMYIIVCTVYFLFTEHLYILVGVVGCCIVQRLSNGAIEPDSDVARVIELQNTVDKQVSCHYSHLKFYFNLILFLSCVLYR